MGRHSLGDQRGRRLVVVLVVLRYLTPWGRQFWRITGGYFVGRQSVRVWLMLGVLLLSVILGGAARRAVQLPEQRPVHGAAEGIPGHRGRRRGGQTVWDPWLLDVLVIFSVLAALLRHPDHGWTSI